MKLLSIPKNGMRHNKLKMIAALLVPLCCASTAMAQTDNPDGPYVGVGWGQFNLNIKNLGDAGTAADDIVHSNDNAWKAFVGYRFNRFLALEAAYIDLGKPSDRFSGTGSNGNYQVDISVSLWRACVTSAAAGGLVTDGTLQIPSSYPASPSSARVPV